MQRTSDTDRVPLDRSGGPRLRVRLLGAAEAERDGRPVPALTTPRLQRLIARLVLARGDPIDRAPLAFGLWPESGDAQARTNLRHALHDLRRAAPEIDECLHLGARQVSWHSDGAAWIDLATLLDRLDRGDIAGAVEVYGGDLLPAAWDDWVVSRRDELRRNAVDALVELAATALGADDHDAARAWSERAIALDPLREVAHRTTMLAHLAGGDRAGALAAYDRCAALLAQELDVAPEPETQRLHRRIRTPARPPGGPDGDDGPALGRETSGRSGRRRGAPPSSPPLVGRGYATDRARRAWDAARAGTAQLLLVTGEPGIGKSRLVAELAGAAEEEGDGAVVARARAYEAAGRQPWAPVADWLRTPALGPRLAAVEPWCRAALARLVPELGATPTPRAVGGDRHDRARHARATEGNGGRDVDTDRGGHTGRHADLARDTARGTGWDTGADEVDDMARRPVLIAAIVRALAGADHPTLLVLDDLQWCDSDTVEAVSALLRAPDARVLVAATARDGEIPRDHPARALQREVAGAGGLAEVALRGLDPDATAALATAVAGAPLADDAVARLHAEAGGNPLFVSEAVRAGYPDVALGDALAPTIHAAIDARLDALPGPTRAVAEVAAVHGRAFDLPLITRATGIDAAVAADAVDDLWHRQIVREAGAEWDFAHDRIRAATYASISPARRRHLHAALAAALLAVHADDPGPVASRTAAHQEAAGLAREAIASLQLAARHAVQVYALTDAVASIRRALALLNELAPGPGRDGIEIDLRAALAGPLVALAGYGAPEAEAAYRRALLLAERIGRPVPPPVRRGLGLAALMSCRFDGTEQQGEALLLDGASTPSGSAIPAHVCRTEGHYLLGVAAFWRGDLERSATHLAAALDAYDPASGAEHRMQFAQDPRAVCLVRLALTRLWQARDEAATGLLAEAQEWCRRIGHPTTTAYVLVFSGIVHAVRGDDAALARVVESVEVVARSTRLDYIERVGGLLGAWSDVRAGRSQARARLTGPATDYWRSPGQHLHLTFALYLSGRANLGAGDVDRCGAAVAEALAWTRNHDQGYLAPALLRLEAERLAVVGDPAAPETRREADDAARRMGAWRFLDPEDRDPTDRPPEDA